MPGIVLSHRVYEKQEIVLALEVHIALQRTQENKSLIIIHHDKDCDRSRHRGESGIEKSQLTQLLSHLHPSLTDNDKERESRRFSFLNSVVAIHTVIRDSILEFRVLYFSSTCGPGETELTFLSNIHTYIYSSRIY